MLFGQTKECQTERTNRWYESTDVGYPEQASPSRQEVRWRAQGLGEEVKQLFDSTGFMLVVMVVPHCEL